MAGPRRRRTGPGDATCCSARPLARELGGGGRQRGPAAHPAAVGHPARIAARAERRCRADAAADRARGAVGERARRVLAAAAARRRARRVRVAAARLEPTSSHLAGQRQHPARLEPIRNATPIAAPGSKTLVRRHAGARRCRAEPSNLVEPVRRVASIALDRSARHLDRRTARERGPRDSAGSWACTATPVLTYLVNGMRAGDRTIPYSLVTAIELTTLVPDLVANDSRLPPIVLNEWAARDLAVKPGDRVTLDYYVWEDPGRLDDEVVDVRARRRSCRSRARPPIAILRRVIRASPISDNLRDWDPPFPIDLSRDPAVDEDYWETLSHDAEGVRSRSVRACASGDRATAQATSIRIAAGALRRSRQFGERLARPDSIRSRWAWRSATCAPRAWPRLAAPPTSASTSPTSASSSSSRR